MWGYFAPLQIDTGTGFFDQFLGPGFEILEIDCQML